MAAAAVDTSGLSLGGIADSLEVSVLPVEVSGLTAAAERVELMPVHAELNHGAIRIDMEINIPKRKPKPPKEKNIIVKEIREVIIDERTEGTSLGTIFSKVHRNPESVYFHEVDCAGFPEFLTPGECAAIIEHAEAQGFCRQHRHNLFKLQWSDVIDPYFAEALWSCCGLRNFLAGCTVDGMVPSGINDLVRIQKFAAGELFGRHTDQEVHRADGRVSKYSLRVFLNEPGGRSGSFGGGLSAFYPGRGARPAVFEPETGLALVYPQGDLCSVQEEQEVLTGVKYVLRADILFDWPEAEEH